MGVTIKDIAREAGVSIATVSHVINKTRYVSPELAQSVEKAIQKTGYSVKAEKKASPFRVGKLSEIAFVVPHLGSIVYSQLSTILSRRLEKEGFLLSIYLSADDLRKEKQIITGLLANKRTAGIILVPVSEDPTVYAKLIASTLPFLCLERTIKSAEIDYILSQNVEAMCKGTEHLIKSGHENIALLLEQRQLTTVEERLDGYKKALESHGIPFRKELVLFLDLYSDQTDMAINDLYHQKQPTAFIAGGNTLTFHLLKTLEKIGVNCPQDVSIVGFGDDEWCDFVEPPLTTLKQDTEELAKIAAESILQKIYNPDQNKIERRVGVDLTIRKSTQIIGRGPFGEQAVLPEVLSLSDTEVERLQNGNYKVAISFHYTGTAWTQLHERAIRDTFDKYGIKVIAVTDAHFDPSLQVTQLDAIDMQKPDAIIAVPADDEKTAAKFIEIAKSTNVVFISNVPDGFDKDGYVACVSVNERENGHNTGFMMGEYFKKQSNIKVGFLTHGMPFYGTRQRDFAAEQVIIESYPNIEIVENTSFYTIDQTYDICQKMLTEHPEIQGLYISWERPALEALRALSELNREDVCVFTSDLDQEIANYMAQGRMVRGISAQRPYEQGVAVAMVTANALIGKTKFKYIGVHPDMVLPKNLLRSWKNIIHETAPDSMVKALSRSILRK